MRIGKPIKPPGWANRFLGFYCKDEFLEEIRGDLLELFEVRAQELGARKARWLFVWDVIRFFRWSNIKKTTRLNSSPMLKNNIIIALRVLRRQKLASFINTVSLTLGITAVTLIYFYIDHELSYDSFHSKSDQVFRLTKLNYGEDGEAWGTSAYHPLPLAHAMVADFPEIQEATRISFGDFYVRQEGTMQSEDLFFADSTVFKLFDFPLLVGDANEALKNPKSAVLSRATALRLFNSTDVLGKALEIRLDEDFEEYIVTAVAEDIPHNSTVRFEILLPYSQLPYYERFKNYWRINTDETYFLIDDKADMALLGEKIKTHWTKYMPRKVKEMEEEGYAPFTYALQPLPEVHLDTEISAMSESSDPTYSYILGAIGLIILLIGCANFMILSIGRSAARGKEIAVRKVIGANRKQLTWQFWTEAMALSVLSAVLAVALIYLLLPSFNALAEKQFVFQELATLENLGVVLLITLISGLLAGFYPSVVLSAQKVLDVFRRKVRLGGANAFTKSLLTFQFALSIVLMLGTITIYQQLHFIKNKELGYSAEDVIVLRNRLSDSPDKFEQFEQVLASNPNVLSAAAISSSFNRGRMQSDFEPVEGNVVPYFLYRVTPEYLDLLELEIAQGRTFEGKLASDTTEAVLVNEVMVNRLGPDFQLGDPLPNFNNAGLSTPRVVGIVKDYHFEALNTELRPVVLTIKNFSSFAHLLVKTTPDKQQETLAFMEEEWYKLAPDVPFSHSFLEDDVAKPYEKEERWGKIIQFAALWAVAIAMMGLIGLVTLTVAGKLKEFGIRKVLGANTAHLSVLITRQFLVWVLIALVIAIPVTVYIMQGWLQEFAYRASMSPFLMGIGILSVLCLILLVIGVNAVRAGKANLVQLLRVE